jgi:hypothetical protein
MVIRGKALDLPLIGPWNMSKKADGESRRARGDHA